MLPTKNLLSFLLFSISAVDANPLVRDAGKAMLEFTRNLKTTGFANLAEHDRARIRAMRRASYGGECIISSSVTNAAHIYTAQVGIGNPPTQYTLGVDTGSSNTWIGAHRSYVPTSSSVNTGNNVSVSYVSAHFSGEEWIDAITLAPGLAIAPQSFGVASNATGFLGLDGLLGLGPVDRTRGTVKNTYEVPTVMNNLYSQGSIPREMLGIYFVPASEQDSHGELTFGGYDSSVVTSSVKYVPLTTISPSSEFWGIDQSVSYGGQTILSSTAGIVDTGTTFIWLARDAFQKYQLKTGGVMDKTNGLLSITKAQYANLQNLTFKMNGATYDLVPNVQIWPRSLNTVIGGTFDSVYLVVAEIGASSGSGLDFVNGYTFLERFYSVFDTSSKAVGFAETKYTKAEIN